VKPVVGVVGGEPRQAAGGSVDRAEHLRSSTGELDGHAPAERLDGAPFTEQGFERIQALGHLDSWLTDLSA
jgi:hypothetical protein